MASPRKALLLLVSLMRDALQLREAALQLERGVRSEVQRRSAVVLGRYYNHPAMQCQPAVREVAHGPIRLKHGGVLVHKVARALAVATRQHLPRALTASLGAKLVQVLRKGLRLLKLRDALAARMIGKTLSHGAHGAAASATAIGAFSAATSRLFMPNLLARAAIVAGSMVAEQLLRHHVAPRVAKLQLSRAVAPTVARLAGHVRSGNRSGASARKPDAGGLLSAWEVALHVMAFVLLARAAWLTFVACEPNALEPNATSVEASREKSKEASSVGSRAHSTTLRASRTKKSGAVEEACDEACAAPLLSSSSSPDSNLYLLSSSSSSSSSPDSVIGILNAQGEGFHVEEAILTEEAWEEFQRGRTRKVLELRRLAEEEAEAKAEAALPCAPVPPARTRRLRFNPKVDVTEFEAESYESVLVPTSPAHGIACSPKQAARGTVDEPRADEPKADADVDTAGVGNDAENALEGLAVAKLVNVSKKTATDAYDATLHWLVGRMIGRGDRFTGAEVDQRRIQFSIRRNLQRVRAAAAPFRAPPPTTPAHFPAAAAALFAPT